MFQHRFRVSNIILWAFLFVTGTVLSVPISVLDNPDFIPLEQRKPIDHSTTEPLSTDFSSAPQYQTGDTVYFICDEMTFISGASGGNDCWGWKGPDGVEYAIMGTTAGLEFYNTATMTFVDAVAGPPCTWRDMVTYDHYCYAVTECFGTNQGLMVVDLQYLPDSTHFVKSVPINSSGQLTSHNLSIDTVKGFAYIEGGSSTNSSIHILSLADPENPAYINSFGPGGGIHDLYAINDTVFVAEGWNPYFSIYELSNKNSPTLLTRKLIPNSGYVHNIWPSEDRTIAVTTEENPNKTVKIWNIENLSNIQLVGEFLGSSGLAHNAQVKDNTIYLSHYESGVVLVDITDPTSPVEKAVFDTYPGDSPDFNGCWGAFPFTSNNLTYGSNMDGRFFILSENEAILTDTLIALDTQAQAGSQVRVDIFAQFSQPIRNFNIPFNWGGPLNLSFDSVSTVGLITEYFEEQDFNAWDPFFKRAGYSMTSSLNGTAPDLPPGEGVILSLFLTIPGNAPDTSNPITFTPFSSKYPTFSHKCLSYAPDTINGEVVTLPTSCCVDIRGNIDGDPNDEINIGDLVYLVAYSFDSPPGPEPPCVEEADVDASSVLDIADIIYMVDYMFSQPSGPTPVACP